MKTWIKDALWYILLPLTLILGVISYFVGPLLKAYRRSKLSEAEKELQDLEEKRDAKIKESDAHRASLMEHINAYKRARSKLRRDNSDV